MAASTEEPGDGATAAAWVMVSSTPSLRSAPKLYIADPSSYAAAASSLGS